MKARKKNRLESLSVSLAVAAGFSSLLCASARGQYFVGSNGRTAEANNRLGSAGLNGAVITNNPLPISSNNVYMGNVTGLGSFHGLGAFPVGTPLVGRTPVRPWEVLDQEVGTSSPTAAPTYNKPQIWYSPYTSEAASAPPTGFQQVGSTGAYAPAAPDTRQPQDYRLGNTLDIATDNGVPLPPAGQSLGGGA